MFDSAVDSCYYCVIIVVVVYCVLFSMFCLYFQQKT